MVPPARVAGPGSRGEGPQATDVTLLPPGVDLAKSPWGRTTGCQGRRTVRAMTFLQRFLGPRGDGKIDKLREVPELAALGEAELAQVAGAGELALIPAGTVLLEEGQLARWCYLVLAGSLLASNETGSARSVPAGEAVGDAEILTREASPATVVATTDLVVLAVGSHEFNGLLEICPGFARAVRISLSHRASASWKPSPSPRPVLQLVRGA